VLSGTLWVNSGSDFDRRIAFLPAGGFVRRLAHTPHYYGVMKKRTTGNICRSVAQGLDHSAADDKAGCSTSFRLAMGQP
jgi:hypothetical protein